MADEAITTEAPAEAPAEAPEEAPAEAAPAEAPVEAPAEPAITEADWRAAIQDEQVKTFAERFTAPADMAKAAFEMRQRMSRAITPLGEDATEEDMAKYRKAMDVPEDPGDYAITPPEDYELSDMDMAILEIIAPIAQANNIPATAFEQFTSAYLEKNIEIRQELERALDHEQNLAAEALKKEWGQDTERNYELSKRFADAAGEEFVEFLANTKIEGAGVLGDHPAMVKFLAENGARFLAEGSIEMMGTRQERASATDRIQQILAEHPIGSDSYKDPKVQKELQGLYALAYGTEGIVGSQGRAL